MYTNMKKLISVLALASTVTAQITSDCNPMEKDDCEPNTALGISNYTINMQKSVMTDKVWNTTAGSVSYGQNGAKFVINDRGDTPTVKTNFYIWYGTVEVLMQAATGQGVVSSIVLLSDTLDEVDWEWIGGNNTRVQTNYFGKGNTTSYDRAIWHPMNDPQGMIHNYTVDWSPEKLDWYIDGQLIRTLKYEQANGGHNFPQTPSDIRLGIWAGGDSKNNQYTIEWAGGETDYDKGPFTMTVASVRIRDASSGTQYSYGDRSGMAESIKVLNVTEPIKLDGNNGGSMSQTASQRWNNMSQGAKIAILASVLGVLVIAMAVFAFCCIKQRRAGKHEKLLEDAKFEKDRAELMAFRAEMGRQRSEKFAMHQQGMRPHTPQTHAGAVVMPSAASVRSANYAPSVSSYNTGRGYQRY